MFLHWIAVYASLQQTAALSFPLCISCAFILLRPVNAAAAADDDEVQPERASVDVKDVICCFISTVSTHINVQRTSRR